jgi:hypothetical protein
VQRPRSAAHVKGHVPGMQMANLPGQANEVTLDLLHRVHVSTSSAPRSPSSRGALKVAI